MNDNSLKVKIEHLCSIKKHRYKILQDYKKQKFYLYTSLFLFITAIFVLIILAYNEFNHQSGIFVFITIFFGIFLYFQSSNCIVCDKSRWTQHLKEFVLGYVHTLYSFRNFDKIEELFDGRRIYCENCDLTNKQMKHYINLLNHEVEIDEDVVRKLFIEK